MPLNDVAVCVEEWQVKAINGERSVIHEFALHCSYGTFGKSLHPVVFRPISPMFEDSCAWC